MKMDTLWRCLRRKDAGAAPDMAVHALVLDGGVLANYPGPALCLDSLGRVSAANRDGAQAALAAVVAELGGEPGGGPPLDRDIYDMTPEELAETNVTPASLEEAVIALETDHEFLTKGDVFTQDVIDGWISWKREEELDPIRLRPHPFEFDLYYNC